MCTFCCLALHQTNAYRQLIIVHLFCAYLTAPELDSRVVLLHDIPSHIAKTGLADGIRCALCFPSPPLLLAFSCDRAADDTDPLWHFTLYFLIAAADSGTAHPTAPYFFYPLTSFLSFFEVTCRGWCWLIVVQWHHSISPCYITQLHSI